MELPSAMAELCPAGRRRAATGADAAHRLSGGLPDEGWGVAVGLADEEVGGKRTASASRWPGLPLKEPAPFFRVRRGGEDIKPGSRHSSQPYSGFVGRR